MFDSSLIKTKYCMPRANPNLLSRGRMLHKLNRAFERMLTLVVAPMGYGKTTAVYEWVEKSGVRAAWLSLDEADNDPIFFWKYFCAACESILPGLTERVEYAFSSQQLLEANVHINILIDELARREGRAALVLDDLHAISNAQIWKGLSHLLAYLPANAHMILISRAEPALDLNPFEIRSQLLRVGVRDLRFRQDEIADFYAKQDFAFGGETLERIGSYTEGWAAAMVAIAVSARNDRVKRDPLGGAAGADADIYRYLMNEVYESYPPEKRDFLLKISILDHLKEDVCAAVTGEDNAARFFADMRRKNEFLTSLGDESGAYRLHPLLKGFLLEKLRLRDPDGFFALHAKAALWYREQGMLPLAVSHYLRGGHYAQAFELVEMQLGSFASKNEYETARLWLEQLPEEYKQKSVKTAVFYSMYHAQRRAFGASRECLARARELLAQGREGAAGSQDRTLVGLVALNLLLREGCAEELRSMIHSGSIPGGDTFRTVEYVDLNDSSVCIYRSPVRTMIKLYEIDRDAFHKLRDYYSILSMRNPGFMPLASAEYLYEKNRTDEALPLFLSALEDAQPFGYPGVLVPAMAGISRIKRSRDDMAGAVSTLEECENRLAAVHKPHWNDLIGALKTRCFIEIGNMDRAERWLRTNKLNIFSEINRVREFELIVLARVLWAKKNANDAEILLMRLLSFAEAENRPHSMVEILNLLSMIAFQTGNARAALEHMERSLRVGLAEGYVRSYLDEQSPMLAVLRQAARALGDAEDGSAELGEFAQSLVSGIEAEKSRPSAIGDAADALKLKKLLTDKEYKVLELLCAACSNEEIGKKLNISQRTVKAHTGNIYGKLGVRTRAQCVKLVHEEGFPL
ncbi:MAG TPA: LuxR C-terminal-related transcriptional regulator [Clostridia bacterium]|nr:LuxR C-terminal-related transcriptional regulator [Clostridia bacterium]